MTTFELNASQEKKLKKWQKSLKKENTGAIGGGYTFSFSPTGLGDVVKVTYLGKHETDLTEYDTW